jgi:hypothetical protein
MYAKNTTVSVDQTKTEIERTLTKYGAASFAYFSDPDRAIVVFEAHERRLRFDLPLPKGDSDKEAKMRRQKWRALLLCIKAKLESVESKIETFEEAFLAHVVLPDGMTVGHHTLPKIAAAYKSGDMPALLPAPAKEAKK